MLTESQFYINYQVKDAIENDWETYCDNLQLEAGETPYFDYALYEIENYPRLNLMLAMASNKHEFITNCYYFLLEQKRFYIQNNVEHQSVFELASNDLKNVFIQYNQLPISVEPIN